MTSGNDPHVLGPGEGRNISLTQHRQRTIMLKAEETATAGAYRLYESTVPASGLGAPPHLHELAEEGFYVLQGALSIQLAEQEVRAEAGTFVLVPRGLVHSFQNPDPVPARYLVIWSPASAGRYFEELWELERTSPSPEESAESIAALRQKYHFVYL